MDILETSIMAIYNPIEDSCVFFVMYDCHESRRSVEGKGRREADS